MSEIVVVMATWVIGDSYMIHLCATTLVVRCVSLSCLCGYDGEMHVGEEELFL